MNLKLSVENLNCAHCAGKITEAIENLPEVKECSLNFMTKKYSINIDDNINVEEFLMKINKIANSIEHGVIIKNPNKTSNEFKTIKLTVENLNCAHCAGKITEAIENLPEVKECSLNFMTKKYSINIDDNINVEEFLIKINKIANSIEHGVIIKNPNKTSNEFKTIKLTAENLNCAHCAGKITEAIENLPEVKECSLNFMIKKYSIKIKDSVDEKEFIAKVNNIANGIEHGVILKKATNISPVNSGRKVSRVKPKVSAHSHSHVGHTHNHSVANDAPKPEVKNSKKTFNFEKISLIIGTVLFISTFLIKDNSIKLIISLVAYLLVGSDVLYKSLMNVKGKNFLDENFLMSIATIGAFAVREYSEAVGVMIFYKIGEYFQEKAVNNSKTSIESLLKLKVVTANLKNPDGSISKIAPEEISIGDILVIKAGENIPVDGVIVSGTSNLNLSALTGESLPIYVEKNSEVLSGSINIDGVLEIRATKEYKNSTINKIIEMIEDAGDKKAHSEKFITKFAKYYTPVVVGIAVIVAFIFPAIMGNFKLWFGRALIFLVISCPCALVLSVPLTFFSSIGYASKNGILIKGGNFLERLKNIDSVVFDKTGTLTENNFQIEKIYSLEESEETVIELAKAGEIYSNHPLGKVILNYKDIKVDENSIADYQEISGKGVSCRYKDSNIMVGNKKLMLENNIVIGKLLEKELDSMVYVAKNGILVGAISFSGIIKKTSAKTIADLKSLGIKSFMLTGDNKISAEKVGTSLGIDSQNIHSELLPQDKVSTLEKIQSSSKGVIYIGDGINDAPVLSLADVGIAMGGVGSDIAIESADIVLLQDDPYKVVEVLKLANINKNIVFQNIVFSLGIKIIVMILGVLGFANMWLAIFADVGVSLLAVLNASRILALKKL